MNSRHRVVTAMSCQQPDRVPTLDLIFSPVIDQIGAILGITKEHDPADGRTGLVYDIKVWCEAVRALELDGTFFYNQKMESLGGGLSKDDFGIIYKPSPHGEAVVVKGIASDMSDLKGLDLIKTVTPNKFEDLQYVIEHVGSDRAHFLVTIDPFRWSWQVRGGMDKFLGDFVVNPQLVHAIQRVTTDYLLATVEMAATLKLDIVGVYMGGDLADERTTLMSPKHFRTFVQPYEKEIVDCAHRHGYKFVKHTDGNLWPILDDLVAAGFDSLHPIQPQCMDIGEVKRRVAGKMCIEGNIDIREILPFGTVDQVVDEVKRIITVAAPGGGYILGSSNSIMPGLNPHNVIAMYEAARKYGVYPDLTNRVQ